MPPTSCYKDKYNKRSSKQTFNNPCLAYTYPYIKYEGYISAAFNHANWIDKC